MINRDGRPPEGERLPDVAARELSRLSYSRGSEASPMFVQAVTSPALPRDGGYHHSAADLPTHPLRIDPDDENRVPPPQGACLRINMRNPFIL